MRGEIPSDRRPAAPKPYDLVREALTALLVIAVLVTVLAAVFSSPDDPPLTLREYAVSSPVSFLQTALGELDGSGAIANYGPPYNHGTASVQSLGPLSLQRLAGVRIPVNAAWDMVLGPLHTIGQVDPAIGAALRRFEAAPPSRRAAWEAAYRKTLDAAPVGRVPPAPAAAGPVGVMMLGLLHTARVGGLDGLLLASPHFYVTDYTRPLLFLSEKALPAIASKLHLLGNQWGMMNETGNYPGAVWLWLYTLWYQVPPFSTSANGDVAVMTLMGLLTLAFILTPWLPGVRRLPRVLGVYRLIWRDWYRERSGRRR